MENSLLAIHNLKISFRTEQGILQAVRGIDLHVQKGQTLALVGESGSGKSVTARAILGICARNAIIESGEIFFDGTDLLQFSENDFNKIRGSKIAMVFQDPLSSLDPIMPVGKQITEAMLLSNIHKPKAERISAKEAKLKAISLMQSVGISDAEKRFYQYPHEFSGGMRQRIVIAIAMSAEPDLLICDEPTTALDVTIQKQILELINALKKQHQMGIIFITHDLGVVANIADTVAVMYAGKIVEQGTVEDIFFRPAHPYTWALLSAAPDLDTPQGSLTYIRGTPPDMHNPPAGDAFAARSDYAMKIDFEREPPLFSITDTHKAATWLLHPDAPKVQMPDALQQRIINMQKTNLTDLASDTNTNTTATN